MMYLAPRSLCFNHQGHDVLSLFLHHFSAGVAIQLAMMVCSDDREPEKSKGPIPFHLVPALVRSLSSDHYVADEGNIVYYQKVHTSSLGSAQYCVPTRRLGCVPRARMEPVHSNMPS